MTGTEWMVLGMIVFGMFIIGCGLIYLGVLYGREDEREKWHKALFADVKKTQSLRWTATVSIVFNSLKDDNPKVHVTAGSTKPAGK